MKLRTKLLIFISIVVALSIILTAVLFDHSAEKMLIAQSRAKALSIACSAATMIDGEAHKQIQSRDDEKSPAFEKIKQDLLRIRNANRRDDTYLKNIFTIFPSALNKEIMLLGVNPAEDEEFSSHTGDVLHLYDKTPPDISKPNIPDDYFEDQWGLWTAAFAPILDKSGNSIGAVVVELPKYRLINRIKALKEQGWIAVAAGFLLALIGSFTISRLATRPLELLTKGLKEIKSGNFATRLSIKSSDEFGKIAKTFNSMAEGLQERETVKSAFARYVSQQVLDSVILSGQAPVVHGNRRKVTALFADIRGFTSLAESLPPEKVVKILNEYFDRMVDIIFKHKGTLDKFLGDGIMVIFGAPNDDQYQEENAIRAAIEMQLELKKLREHWMSEGNIEIKIGIGINSGSAIVGNIGSSKRMEYTAIGDCINIAARLESATREHEVDILISDYTYHAVKGVFNFSKVGAIHVKGRVDPVITYAVSN